MEASMGLLRGIDYNNIIYYSLIRVGSFDSSIDEAIPIPNEWHTSGLLSTPMNENGLVQAHMIIIIIYYYK